MDWIDTVQATLAALGLKLLNVVVAAVGSFVSMRFFDGMSLKDKWLTFLGGWMIAAWGAAPLREWLEQKPSIEIGFVILLSLFGMALTAEVIKVIKDTDWRGYTKSGLDWLLNRKTGGEK
jgi:hypothetical protein